MKNETQEILATINEYLEKLAASLQEIADQLRERKSYQMTDFVSIFEGIRWVSAALTGTTDEHSIDFDIKKQNAILSKTLNAIESNDVVLMANIIEYEFIPFFNELHINITTELQPSQL